MKEMKSVGSFISTEKCLNILHGLEPIEETMFHLSFDDGFKNNYENAVPILKELGIPAIFFVTTELMTCTPDRQREFSIDMGGYCEILEYMTWNDLRHMNSLGFEIGSHTVKHSRLSSIEGDHDLIKEELSQSKIDIERELDAECLYFAWPYGRTEDITANILDKIQQYGYKGCFSGIRGMVDPGVTSAFCIPRHSLEPYWPLRHIKLFLAGNYEKKYSTVCIPPTAKRDAR